jgi:hypothetical protein
MDMTYELASQSPQLPITMHQMMSKSPRWQKSTSTDCAKEREPTARQNDELIDVTDRNKGMLKLTRIEHNSLRQRMHGHDVIGVGPGLRSVITALRSEDSSDKLEIGAALWKQHRLDAAFQREEAKI